MRQIETRLASFPFGSASFGRPILFPFAGETSSDILGAVLKLEPDWSGLPRDTPAGVQRLLRRCLQKDRKRRLHDIADARLELEEAPGETTAISQTARTSARTTWLPWLLAAAGLTAAAAAVALYVRGRPAEAGEQRAEINVQPARRGVLSSIAISPDGATLAFVGVIDGVDRLWIRSLASAEAQPLTNTDGASYPFWSPDSQSIGFFADRLPQARGHPERHRPDTGRCARWRRLGRHLEQGRGHPVQRRSELAAEPHPGQRQRPGR